MPVLEELGVREAMEEAGFLRKWGATMVWGRDPEPWSWYFRETNGRHPHAYQVWRPQFDLILLENARANGVEVREGHQAVEVLFDGERSVGVRFRHESGEGEVRSRYVVDASGQAGLLANRLKLRQWDSFFRNLAVYGYFEGGQRLAAPDETNIFIESYPNGWFWQIPLHTGLMSVGAVVDAEWAQQPLREAGAREFLYEQIAAAPHSGEMLRDAEMVAGPFIQKDWSYLAERLVGDGYILAGDAACFVDPLFSSGVHLALSSGVLAAAYVTSVLRDDSMAGPAAEVYRDLYLSQYSQFHEMAKLFYASNRSVDSYFWEARRILGRQRFSPREAFIQAVAGQPPKGCGRSAGAGAPQRARALPRPPYRAWPLEHGWSGSLCWARANSSGGRRW
jgi:flavin-dependent dehydrogenase